MQRVAGAKAIPCARRADGAPQQARTSPRPQAGEGSRRCPTRHAADGVQPHSRDYFRSTEKRGVRGCRGCRGAAAPLTPCPAPGRRPAARSGQQPPYKEEEKNTVIKRPTSHPLPRAGQATRRPCRAAAAIHDAVPPSPAPTVPRKHKKREACLTAQSDMLPIFTITPRT